MERELKFLLEHAHAPTLPSGFRAAEPQPAIHLLDEYLDYRGELLAAGWRLRRRRSDGVELRYTLKSEQHGDPSSPLRERVEIERASEHDEQIPLKIVAALDGAGVDTAHVLDHLQPYLTLRQERHPVALTTSDGEIALLSVDEVRASGSAADGELRWTELEIEFLDSVSPEVRNQAAAELTAWLTAQPGVTPGGESKVARAARLLSISI